MPNESTCGGDLRRADREELTEVIARNHIRMLARAARLLRDDEEARDAVQDAYLQAVRHLDRFDGRARLSTWLHSIVVNAALARLRSRRRHPTTPLDATTIAAETPGPEHLAHAREVQAMVRRSLAAVPSNDRRVILMSHLADGDSADVARALRVSRNALKVRACRARKALRARLLELGITDATGASAARPGIRPAWPLREVS